MSGRGGKALTILAVGAVGWYTGVKFWQPLIIEQLRKDENLRTDIPLEEIEDDSPQSWDDLKQQIKKVIRPETAVPVQQIDTSENSTTAEK